MSTRLVEARSGHAQASTPAEGTFSTPWGDGVATVHDGRLVGVELPPVSPAPSRWGPGSVADKDAAVLRRWIGELDQYFRGERLCWSLEEVNAEREGMGEFARRTTEALMVVPAGSTISYGALASLAGYPRAARAVGTLMATNVVPIVIPCHRVIRSDGSLGRYGRDSSWKELLLTHERDHVARVR